jgi:hypothetical protein
VLGAFEFGQHGRREAIRDDDHRLSYMDLRDQVLDLEQTGPDVFLYDPRRGPS